MNLMNLKLRALLKIDNASEESFINLLEAGANPNLTEEIEIVHSNETGFYPPLLEAIIRGHTNAVRALLKYGASTNLPLSIFNRNTCEKVVCIFPIEMAEKLALMSRRTSRPKIDTTNTIVALLTSN